MDFDLICCITVMDFDLKHGAEGTILWFVSTLDNGSEFMSKGFQLLM